MVLQLYTFPKCLSQLIFKPHQEHHSRDFKALTLVAVPSWRLSRFVFWALLLIPKKTVCLEKVSKLPLWDISEYVRASKLRHQLQNASCGQKLPTPGISVPESHQRDLMLKWVHLMRREAGRRAGTRAEVCFLWSPRALRGRTYWTNPDLGLPSL